VKKESEMSNYRFITATANPKQCSNCADKKCNLSPAYEAAAVRAPPAVLMAGRDRPELEIQEIRNPDGSVSFSAPSVVLAPVTEEERRQHER